MQTAIRIAAAQLASSSRGRRRVPAGPLVALLHESPHWVLSVVLHAAPGEAVSMDEVPSALTVVRKAFADEGKRMHVELVEEASPGMPGALVAAGLEASQRMPLLTVDPAQVLVPDPGAGVTVEVVRDSALHAVMERVAAAAFGSQPLGTTPPAMPAAGGSVLVRLDDEPVAVAAWTAVEEGVTEIVGVGTLPEYRRRGLGTLAAAHAVRAAVREGGATLPWLTPGDGGADRVYRRIGFAPVASCVHLTEREAS